MPLEFTNIIKGLLTQTMLAALFEKGGYRVTRLGIEELFSEIKHIDLEQYLGLKLPLPLRFLPDLLVAELDMSNVFMVEVKYRRRFDAKQLHTELREQLEYWPQSNAVIMVSEPIPFRIDATFNQDYIRVLRPADIHNLNDGNLTVEQKWDRLPHLHQVFKALGTFERAHLIQQSADSLTQTLKDLSNLRPVD